VTELVTSAGMQAIERDAIASGEVTGLGLMETAGRGVVDAILRWRRGLADGRYTATILCGPGNNGGDGYVIARLLRTRGWEVRVLGMGETAAMPPDARANRERWETMGAVAPLTHAGLRDAPESDLYIDAVFGTGLKRAPDGDLLALLRDLGSGRPPFAGRLVAVDAPSGLDLDSGRMLAGGRAEPASASVPLCSLTVTFEVPKVGHVLADGPATCGQIAIVDLGLLKWRRAHWAAASGTRLIDLAPMIAPAAPEGHRPPDVAKRGGHKYDHGHAVIVSGPAGRTGAARLAARAALRIGAGLVTVASPSDALAENAAHLTAVMVRPCDGAEALAEMLRDARFNAICLGPGMGVGEATRAMVLTAMGGARKVVLDADALTSFADAPDALFDAIAAARGDGSPHDTVVLTPHAGEFGRLFPDLAEAWRGGALSKLDATRAAAGRSGAVVLLKGADTVVAASNGTAAINCAAYDRAVPWLATAGAGDVLAGLITGLAARMPDLARAVEDAAWLHVETAREAGPGMIAEDLPEAVPAVLRRVLAPGGLMPDPLSPRRGGSVKDAPGSRVWRNW
jgi:hydroxyethylthiazole kinase-like uncharacterized protein yjeF